MTALLRRSVVTIFAALILAALFWGPAAAASGANQQHLPAKAASVPEAGELLYQITGNGHITGTVTGPDGVPLAAIEVQAWRENTAWWELAASATTDSEGRYDLSGLGATNYRVKFIDTRVPKEYAFEYYDNQATVMTAQNVYVPPDLTTPDINAQLDVGAHITGTVTDGDGGPLSDISVEVLAKVTYYYGDVWEPVGAITTTAAGAYDIGGLMAGSYRVRFRDPTLSYAEVYYNGQADPASAELVTVGVGQVRGGVDAQMPLGSHITGTVRAQSSGDLLASTQVRAYRFDGASWYPAFSALSDASGVYDLKGLPASVYRVGFSDSRWPRQYMDQYYDMQPGIDSATPVSVGVGVTVSAVDAWMYETSHISGTVTNEAGSPLPGMYVQLLQQQPPYWWTTVGTRVTDSAGGYDFDGLSGGVYRIQYQDLSGSHASEYWDDKFDLGSADSITLTPGVSVGGVNAVLGLAGRITGTVRDAAGATLANMRVYGYRKADSSWSLYSSAMSDAGGSYALAGLPPGDYRVFFQDSQWPMRYLAEYYDDALAERDALTLSVTAGGTVGGVDAVLAAVAHITGTVTDVGGAPIPGVSVSAFRLSDGQWINVAGSSTDSSGHYDLTGFGGGEYRVGFAQGLASPYFSEYYDDQPDLASATSLFLADGEVRSGVDAQLARSAHITGRVTDEAGSAVYAVVNAYRWDGSDWAAVGVSWVAPAGTYDIGGLPAGIYRIRFAADPIYPVYVDEYYDNQPTLDAADNITVTEGATVSGIDAQLAWVGAISGRVYQADGVTPIPNATVNVMDLRFQLVASAISGPDGGYSARVPSGSYYLAVRAAGYGGVYYDNGYDDPHATPVSVAAPAETSNINFRLSPEATLSGHVHAANGAPLEGITVDVSPHAGGQIRRATTGSDGAYVITGLSTGSYVAKAHAPGYADAYYAGATTWDTATPIAVTQPTNTPGIDFVLQQVGSIAGAVVAADGGTPLANIAVYAERVSDHRNWYDCTDASGQYRVESLPYAEYRIWAKDGERCSGGLSFLQEYWNDKSRWTDGDVVTVSAAIPNVAGIDLALEAGGGSIAGFVFEADGVTPIPGADIWAAAQDDEYDHHAVAQSNGSYRILSLRDDTYTVKARATGRVQTWFDQKWSYWVADGVVVAAPGERSNVNFALAPAGAISGRLTREDGTTPIVNACVDVSATAPEWNQVAGFCCTDASGAFTIQGVPAGSVFVKAHANCRGENPYVVDEWYAEGGSTTDGALASPIAIQADQTRPDINLALDVSGAISGHAYQGEGTAPVAGAWIEARNVATDFVNGGRSQADGSYRIPGLPPGVYRVSIEAAGYAGFFYEIGVDSAHAKDVVVGANSETPAIDFHLFPEATVSGHVYTSDGLTPLAGVTVDVWPQLGGQIWRAVTGADGAYTAHGVATGVYVARARAEGYVTQFYAGAPSWDAATPISTQQPNDTPDIDFRLLRSGEITGLQAANDGPTLIGVATTFTASVAAADTVTYTWDLGDGMAAAGAVVTHVYAQPGLYTATVTARSAATAAHASTAVQVLDAPIAQLTAAASSPTSVGAATHFTASVGSGTNVTFAWAFGDGAGATGATQTHTYGAAGVYTAVVTATNSRGAATASVQIVVGSQSAVVEPTSESTVVISGTNVTTIQVPAAAVGATTELVFSETLAPLEGQSGFSFAGRAFTLDAYQEGAQVENFTFAKAVTVTLHYADADVTGLDEATLMLLYWTGTAWSDAACGAYDRHPADNWLAVPICHLSWFALFGEVAESEEGDALYLPAVAK